MLGLYFTLAPLLGSAAREAADGGEVVPLVIGLAAPIAITALGVAHVLRFTHYGVELLTRHDEDEFSASLMFDVESALWLNLKIGDFEIVTSLPDKPIKVRYKAIGFALDVPPTGSTRFLPVFDSSRGYTIDLADSGSLRVLPALGDAIGDIIQVLGARIARTNPLNIEVELGLGVDLGVFSVDRFGFRLPVDPLGTPSITSIGVGVNIPNVLKGSGYLEIKSDGFAGQLDLTLPSVGMRIAGGLAVRTVSEGARSATGVLVTLALELPTGIPLGGTGLAIFGFLGIFAMHHKRLEDAGERNPALAWLANVARGDPTDIRAWGPALDQWAFGVGLVAGTIEGGTVLNLKGMLVLELPGPRVLLLVKANVLSPKPETKGTATGTLFAVVDVSPQRVLIGLQFEYHIESVLDLMIPIEAGFFYDPPEFPPEHFYIDVGTIARPVTAKILELFEATAYLMVHGDGIPDFPLGPLGGFSLAMGFHVSFTWGNTRIGLYLRVAAGFDAGIGFAPLFFAGRVYLEGELRLFIIGLSVRGELTFLSDGKDTRLEGRICGKIDLFFFSIEGCVGFAIGDLPGAPYAPPAIRDLKLQSRSPALVLGTGVDRGIDTVLCSGTADGSVPQIEVRDGDNVTLEEVFVPIDSIPLIQFEVAPELAASATIDGQLSSGLPPGFGSGWQKRGPSFLRYHISSISLELVAVNGGAVPSGMTATTEGPRPYTWRHPAQQASSDGLPVELALLDWKPTNVDKVMVEGPALDGTVDDRFGEVCEPIAEPARVLWTFRKSRLGPSSAGFKLTGDPWPDAEDARRSQPVPTSLHVEELWRTGTFLDGLCPTLPAEVVGAQVACPKIVKPERALSPSLVLADRLRLAASSPSLRDHAALATALGVDARALTRASTRTITPITPKCVAKVLAAPFELPGELFPRGMDDALRKILIELDRRRGDDLRNVVRLSGGPFVELTLLVFARIKMVDAGFLKVRALAADGAAVGVSTSFKRISTLSDLPASWRQSTGPWWDDVALARSYLGEGIDKNSFGEYLVRIKLEAPALTVDVGISPLDASLLEQGMAPPSWLLASIEGLSLHEVMRATDDAREAEDDARGIEDALGDARHALLHPNAEYRVSVEYSAEVGRKPLDSADPDEIEIIRTEASTVASRTFFTDAEPPRSLEPWMLAQFPSPAEGYHFTDDPVVIVFGTDDVLELFGAYDRELRAVARAASFRGSAGTPDAERTHIMLRELFERLGGVVLSPWEATVRRLLGGRPCGDFNPDAARHGRVSLPFMLDPLTDYVVDLEALDAAGAVVKPSPRPQDVGERPLYRHSFTTSRYRSRAEMAAAVRLALPSAQLLTNPVAIDGLAEKLSDEAFDLALHAAGLEVAPRPEDPRVSVLFDNGTPASPLAVLIETPEPLWRSRLEPTAEHDDSGEHIERWVLEKKPWLLVDELVPESETPIGDGGGFVCGGTGVCDTVVMSIAELRDYNLGLLSPAPSTPPVLPNARVEKLIHDESGTRTLVVLRGAARNTRLALGLVRLLHPLLDADTSDTPEVLLDLELTAPAWEER